MTTPERERLDLLARGRTIVRVAIVGSRGYRSLWKVVQCVDRLPTGAVVVSGGARGVDETAARVARTRGLEVVELLADWRKYGRKAGILRNRPLIEGSDVVLAFWDGKSPGTANSIGIAKELGKPTRVFLDLENDLPSRTDLGMFLLTAKPVRTS